MTERERDAELDEIIKALEAKIAMLDILDNALSHCDDVFDIDIRSVSVVVGLLWEGIAEINNRLRALLPENQKGTVNGKEEEKE